MQTIKTTELPLAAKLMALGGKLDEADPFRVVHVRGRDMVEFSIQTEHPAELDRYQTGADGIAAYEASRRFIVRIIKTTLGENKK